MSSCLNIIGRFNMHVLTSRLRHISQASRVSSYNNCSAWCSIEKNPTHSYSSSLNITTHTSQIYLRAPLTIAATCWPDQKRWFAIRRKDYKFPEVRPEDLEEEFVRGSGPGGQSVNKTSNCVVLKHVPSGIVIKCHETRSLNENRKRARLHLEERLDLELNGDQSFLSKVKAEGEEAKQEKKRRNSRRLALKAAFKEREGLS